MRPLAAAALAAARSTRRGICAKARIQTLLGSLQLRNQVLPTRIFGIVPKSALHRFMRPFLNNFGASAVNTGKYLTSLRRHTFRQSHAAFHFLFDYVPHWERAYGRRRTDPISVISCRRSRRRPPGPR